MVKMIQSYAFFEIKIKANFRIKSHNIQQKYFLEWMTSTQMPQKQGGFQIWKWKFVLPTTWYYKKIRFIVHLTCFSAPFLYREKMQWFKKQKKVSTTKQENEFIFVFKSKAKEVSWSKNSWKKKDGLHG